MQGRARQRGAAQIRTKTPEQLAVMRGAGRILARTLEAVGEHVRPGVSTKDLDTVAAERLAADGAIASFLGLYDFPASVCVAVNDVVVHGIPSAEEILKEGDIVGVDIGVYWHGFHVDAARTYAVGVISRRVRKLVSATEDALRMAILAARVGATVSDISRAVQEHAESKCGYHCVRALCGHGVGFEVHEEPQVPNYVSGLASPRLVEGMTLAIEPMVNMGTPDVFTDGDGWSVRAADGRPSAHFEHTVAITSEGPVILTSV